MTDGQKKGSRYMLDICRVLSHWVCDTPLKVPARDLPFRTRSTSIMPIDGHWDAKGDLVCHPSVYFPFAVECKNRENGRLDSILEAPNWPVWEWWEQTQTQARQEGTIPLLIFSRNRRENHALLERRVARCLHVRPLTAPLLEVVRPSGEVLTLCLLSDLTAVPASLLRFLQHRRTSSPVRKSSNGSSRSCNYRLRKPTRSGSPS